MVVQQEFWSSWKSAVASLFLLLPDSLLPGRVVPVMVQSLGQIDVFENFDIEEV